MTTNDYANTNTKTKREWRRKACVIDLKKIRDEEIKPRFRRRKLFFLGLAVSILLASSTMIANAQGSKVTATATVPGWYEISQPDNERLELKTNMTVYINGRLHKNVDNASKE